MENLTAADAGTYALAVDSTLELNNNSYSGHDLSDRVQLILPMPQDFNGDGKSDLVWSNMITGDRSVWFMNGTTIRSITWA